MKFLCQTLLLLIVFMQSGWAQFVNDGAKIFVSNNALLFVGDKVIHKNGEINHYGDIVVKGNWENNSATPVFNSNSTGKVSFDASYATFLGGGTTIFPHLHFRGNGVYAVNSKLDIRLGLNLGAAEVQTLVPEALTLSNTEENSLVTITGFINTKEGVESSFIRHTKSTGTYLFPVGSSKLNTMGFVGIEPNDEKFNIIGVSFVGNDPSFDGYSTSSKKLTIESVNSRFYHIIKRISGNSNLAVTLSTVDTELNTIVNWLPQNRWEDVKAELVDKNNLGWVNYSRAYEYKSANLPIGTNVPLAFAHTNQSGVIDLFNAFSPDGDGKNDTWEIGNIDTYPDNSLKIFDRSGNLVFQAKGYSSAKFWDGGNFPSGTYMYVLRVNINGTDKHYRGAITMVKN